MMAMETVEKTVSGSVSKIYCMARAAITGRDRWDWQRLKQQLRRYMFFNGRRIARRDSSSNIFTILPISLALARNRAVRLYKPVL